VFVEAAVKVWLRVLPTIPVAMVDPASFESATARVGSDSKEERSDSEPAEPDLVVDPARRKAASD
jgi:hypothetical protein